MSVLLKKKKWLVWFTFFFIVPSKIDERVSQENTNFKKCLICFIFSLMILLKIDERVGQKKNKQQKEQRQTKTPKGTTEETPKATTKQMTTKKNQK